MHSPFEPYDCGDNDGLLKSVLEGMPEKRLKAIEILAREDDKTTLEYVRGLLQAAMEDGSFDKAIESAMDDVE